eukprot:g6677.t1
MGRSSSFGNVPTSRVTFTPSSAPVNKRISELNSQSRAFQVQNEIKRFGRSLSEQSMDEKPDAVTNRDSPYSRGECTRSDRSRYLSDTEFPFEYETTFCPSSHDGVFLESNRNDDDSVPVFVMLPLDTIDRNGHFKYVNSQWFHDALKILSSTGVRGVTVDIWWGVVEFEPLNYTWTGYRALFEVIRSTGLKIQAILSFHACGDNVGDVVEIPLPQWVLDYGQTDPDIFLSDKPRHHTSGQRNKEYLSLFADEVPALIYGRSPMECYSDFMIAFRDEFETDLVSLIVEVVIGAGPCGELRYPSYAEANGWRFPGIGEFQCYDRHALSSLAQSAVEHGHKEWGYGGPHDSGTYNNWPQDTSFFHGETGAWSTQYGQFFLQWYSNCLVQHGRRLMKTANSIFRSTKTQKTGRGVGTKSTTTESTVLLNGMKAWIEKTNTTTTITTALCQSPSVASGLDPSFSEFSTTGSIRSASMGSLIRDSSDDSITKSAQTNNRFTSCILEADSELLELSKGVFAHVRATTGLESVKLKDSANSFLPVQDRVPDGIEEETTTTTPTTLAQQWETGDFVRRITSFLQYHHDCEDQTPSSIELSLKIAGIHWWYRTQSHAAELTAGYFNSGESCGYEKIVHLCREFDFNLILTCVEMSDAQHSDEIRSSPQGLVHQIQTTAATAGVKLSGENALPVFHPLQGGVDVMALERIIKHCHSRNANYSQDNGLSLTLPKMHSFTFLRLVPELLSPLHQGLWMRFMQGMQEPSSYLGVHSSSSSSISGFPVSG